MSNVSTTTVDRAGAATGRLLPVAVVGLLAGFLAGLFGVGGGILIVPGLVLTVHMTQRLAHGTSLAAVVPISVASLISYAAHGNVDWNVAVWLAIGAVGGAVVGTACSTSFPSARWRSSSSWSSSPRRCACSSLRTPTGAAT